MKILVPIKLSLDTSQIKFDESTGEPIYEAIPKKMGDADKCALEEALKIKDDIGASITVVTIGYSREHIRMIRDAYAMGVDEAYIVKAADGDKLSVRNIAEAIKNFIDEKGLYDVILLGQWSNDTHSSTLHSILSAMLNIPLIPNVDKLEYDGESFRGLSNMEDGIYTFESKPPLIISITSEANLPRIPTLKDILRAKRMKINELELDKYLSKPIYVSIKSVKRYLVERKKVLFKDEEKIDEALEKVINIFRGEGLL